MAEYEDVSIFLEEHNELFILKLLPADVIRVQSDPAYLLQLVNAERRLQSQPSESSPSEQNTANKGNESPLFIWTEQGTYLLLSLYEKHKAEFSLEVHKHNKIWKTIALIMDEHGYKVSWGQCQSKLYGLKKTYKRIMDHDNTSGYNRMTWPYLAKMNDIFGKTSEAQPKALASEAGPSSSVLSSSRKPTTPKRNCDRATEKYNTHIKEYIFLQNKKEKNKQERHKIKMEKIEKMMALKERHCEEIMKAMNSLIEAISKNK